MKSGNVDSDAPEEWQLKRRRNSFRFAERMAGAEGAHWVGTVSEAGLDWSALVKLVIDSRGPHSGQVPAQLKLLLGPARNLCSLSVSEQIDVSKP